MPTYVPLHLVSLRRRSEKRNLKVPESSSDPSDATPGTVMEKAVCLLSGGLDSPPATCLALAGVRDTSATRSRSHYPGSGIKYNSGGGPCGAGAWCGVANLVVQIGLDALRRVRPLTSGIEVPKGPVGGEMGHGIP